MLRAISIVVAPACDGQLATTGHSGRAGANRNRPRQRITLQHRQRFSSAHSIPSRLHQIRRLGMKRLIPLLPKRSSPKFMTSPVVCPATSCRKAIASQPAAIQQARTISIVARATWNECEAPISSCAREAPTIGIGRNICAVCGQTKTCKEFRNKAGRLKLRRRSWNSNSQTPSEQYHQLVGGRGNIITFT